MFDLVSELAHARMYTMRELSQDTSRVMREINESDEPAVITRHGRFMALVFPLVHADVESHVLGAVIQAVENKRQLTGEVTISGMHDAQTVADDLGLEIDLRHYNNRERGAAPALSETTQIKTPNGTFPISLVGLTPSQRASVRHAAEAGKFEGEAELRRWIASLRRENELGNST